MTHALYDTLQCFETASGQKGRFYSLPALEAAGIGPVSQLPVSIRIVLESVLRNYDGLKITEDHIKQLANWEPNAPRSDEIPFVVARVILQDFTGIPLLCDLAAMRNVAEEMKKDPKCIEPLVPVDLVVDHSVSVDVYGVPGALHQNMKIEFQRNGERYQFLKWGMQAFDTFKVIPPGIGIVHQVNLEYLFRGVQKKKDLYYPDTLVGTDSHTTMINGVAVVGWGVGGIEAEAAMLGQPVYFLTPDVVGVELVGELKEGITATDLVLTITERLRREKVVGKFVEFFGSGAEKLGPTDRATIANMAPEYGATMGFFPVDEKTVEFLRLTGRSPTEVEAFEAYFKAQNLFGMPKSGDIRYSKQLCIDLASIVPSLAGPRRPQDRVPLAEMKDNFTRLFPMPLTESGFNKSQEELSKRYPTRIPGVDIGHGDVLIAAITSCTNTSNPGAMLAAGILARKAVEKGLSVRRHVKTSLAPGSRIVTEYFNKAGLLEPLNKLGFALAGYGCTTCIGNAGDLAPELNEAILENDIIACSVLSGNRNFEARIHPNIKANFLASPALVVAFAIAGRVTINMEEEPLGIGSDGQPVYLRDIWPTSEEIHSVIKYALDPNAFQRLYSNFTKDHDMWNIISTLTGNVYHWPDSTYIARPPFFHGFKMKTSAVSEIRKAKCLLMLEDMITTDHISPAGPIKANSPAGQYLLSLGVSKEDFNSYGSRRGNHEVMVRGTFANVRIKNLMIPTREDGTRVEGGYTLLDGQQTTVYDAAMEYIRRDTPTIVIAGQEYGAGSSRDWAAKGTQLLGVRAVIAESFERIHRSNLVAMGVLPLQFKSGENAKSLGLTGQETFDIIGISEDMKPQQEMIVIITNPNGTLRTIVVQSRIDTPIEIAYYKHGGIMPFVLRQIFNKAPVEQPATSTAGN